MWRCRWLLLCTPQMSNLGHAVAVACGLLVALHAPELALLVGALTALNL
jgi:uncharacterized protein YhhL (DUF1145 family)